MPLKLSPNGVVAVLFDLDGTLRHNLPSYNQAIFDYAVQLGAADSPERRRSALRWVHYYWAQSPEMLRDQETHGGLSEAFWIYYAYLTLINFGCPEAQAQALAPQVQQRMAGEYQPVDHVPPDAWDTLAALREAGFRLGVASNRSKPYGEQMAALGLEPFFQFALAAGEIKSWKPEPGIFLHAVELLGVQPGQTVYVGDNYYADSLGAANAGLRPVLLDPEGLFPEAACPVITSLGGLLGLLSAHSQ
jgi:HAD superfamily hydrolase (TIGR01549 family)